MSDLRLNDDTGDLDVTEGALSLVEGDEALAQRIAQRLRLVRGEWFLAYLDGTDYYGQIFGKKPQVTIDAEFVRVITTTPGVAKLTAPISYNFRTDRNQRVLEVSFSVQSAYTGNVIPLTYTALIGEVA